MTIWPTIAYMTAQDVVARGVPQYHLVTIVAGAGGGVETYRYFRGSAYAAGPGIYSATGGGQWVLISTDPLPP